MSQDSPNSKSSSAAGHGVREWQLLTRAGQILKSAVAFIGLILMFAVGTVAQTPSPTQTPPPRRIILPSTPNREIPDATPPYTPEEAKWWQDLQAAAKAVKKTKGGKKESQKFLEVLQEGQEKSWQPPVPDTKPFILSKAMPSYGEQARLERINGIVILTVELRADGYVGEVEITQGLGHGLDERAADAARRTIFLPAVKDRKFAGYKVHMEMSFSVF
ncbi:MAG: energy transducer TonB [Acidobacteriota bacterium]|nr:energy transducer TonB [Acidobacteriota bacterium]